MNISEKYDKALSILDDKIAKIESEMTKLRLEKFELRCKLHEVLDLKKGLQRRIAKIPKLKTVGTQKTFRNIRNYHDTRDYEQLVYDTRNGEEINCGYTFNRD